MTKTQFTPGPWLIGEVQFGLGQGIRGQLTAGDSYTICYAQTPMDGSGARHDIREANARLIAAAPELYEALTEAGGYVREVGTPAALGCLERVTAALRKARGE